MGQSRLLILNSWSSHVPALILLNNNVVKGSSVNFCMRNFPFCLLPLQIKSPATPALVRQMSHHPAIKRAPLSPIPLRYFISIPLHHGSQFKLQMQIFSISHSRGFVLMGQSLSLYMCVLAGDLLPGGMPHVLKITVPIFQ